MTETKTTATAPTLTLRRAFDAPRARVYDAWTKPDVLKEWFGPAGFTIPSIAMNLVVGGAYTITMRAPDGEDDVVRGEFKAIRPPEHLSYTWLWDEMPPDPQVNTLVSIDFIERGSQTEILLTHEGFASAESRDRHQAGWLGTFESLEKLVTT